MSYVRWHPPPAGWVKVNCDGSFHADSGAAGVAAIIRDAQANWVCASTQKLTGVDILAAELWAIRDGLKLAWDMGFRAILLETNALLVVELITAASHPTNHLLPLIFDCRTLLGREWTVDTQSIYREVNQVADVLARSTRNQVNVLNFMYVCPSFATSVFNSDAAGRATLIFRNVWFVVQKKKKAAIIHK